MSGTVLLLSGGMDSALCLHWHGADLAVGFDYGQRHVVELAHASRIARHYGVAFDQRRIPDMPRIDDVVFAGRNAVLLSTAAAIAQERGLGAVMIGCNFSDAQRFPDCRPSFLQAISRALLEAYDVRVLAPLLTMTKAQIVQEAAAVGLPATWTCYAPTADGLPCGACFSCRGLQS